MPVAEIDVQHGHGGPSGVDEFERALHGGGRGDGGRAQAMGDILGVQRDDQTVLDQQNVVIGQDRVRNELGVADGGTRVFDRLGAVRGARFRQMARRDAEHGVHAPWLIGDVGRSAEIIGNRPADDGGAEALARRRGHRRSADLPPLHDQVSGRIAAPADHHPPVLRRKTAVLVGVCDQLVQDQSHGRVGVRVQENRFSLKGDASSLIDEGGRFRVDQRLEGRGSPVVVGDLVMGARQGVDASVHDLDEVGDAGAGRLRLADQSPYQTQNIAHPMIEFRNQQLLTSAGLLALGGGFVGETQDDLDEGRPQGFRNPYF
ncbi:hypothetical protein D3C72_1022720 [compost metagenome]